MIEEQLRLFSDSELRLYEEIQTLGRQVQSFLALQKILLQKHIERSFRSPFHRVLTFIAFHKRILMFPQLFSSKDSLSSSSVLAAFNSQFQCKYASWQNIFFKCYGLSSSANPSPICSNELVCCQLIFSICTESESTQGKSLFVPCQFGESLLFPSPALDRCL